MSHVIAAVSTGPGVSAIGILRLSGEGCARVAGQVFRPKSGRPLEEAPNRKLILGTLLDEGGRVLDQCMAVYTRGPHSYTGEDTVELHCHGSPPVLAAGLEALYRAGALPARRGEFTKRAFLNGQMDLTQAEAVIDLIEAETADAAANAAGQVGGALVRRLEPIYHSLTDLCSHFHAVLDYPDEDIEDFRLPAYLGTLEAARETLDRLLATAARGRILRQGIRAVILGKPNVGKSSLLNALAGFRRVIVTEIPGTTRDTVEESVLLGGLRLRLVDTAGIRDTGDEIEAMGVSRSLEAAREAELALFVCDGSRPLSGEDWEAIEAAKAAPHALCLVNKADLPQAVDFAALPFDTVLPISAKEGTGLEALTAALGAIFGTETPCDGSILTNARQTGAVARARDAVSRTIEGLAAGLTPDALLTDVEEALEAMGELSGRTVREDITNRIFERFCVGK